MRRDFWTCRPPGWIAASTSSTGASRTASQEGRRSRRRRKATSRLRSFVDCESTVSTSSASGSPCGAMTRHAVDVAQALAHARGRGAPAAGTRPRRRRRGRHGRGGTGAGGSPRLVEIGLAGAGAQRAHRDGRRPAGLLARRGRRPPGRPAAGPVPPRRPDELRRLAAVPAPHRRARARPPGLRPLGQARATATTRWPATTPSSSASSTSPASSASASWCTTGAPSACCGPSATPSASSGSSSSTPCRSLPGYRWHRVARVWRTRGARRARRWARTTRFALRQAPLAARCLRRRGPGRTSTRAPSARSCASTARAPPEALAAAGARLGDARLPGARRLGRATTPTSRRASRTPSRAVLGGPGEVELVAGAGHWPWLRPARGRATASSPSWIG